MLHLIRLEFKKYKFNGNIAGVLIANLLIALFTSLFYFVQEMDGEDAITSYSDLFLVIDLFVRSTFIIFAAVLLSKFIIDEYKNKTIFLMFTYPVNRRKLIIAKLLIIAVWTFLVIVFSSIIVTSILLVINANFDYISEALTAQVLVKQGLNMLVNAIAAAGISLIPLYFGMRTKSVPATIVSAIIIAILINNSNNGFSLSSIIAIPLSLAVIGVLFSYLSFRNIENVDVM